jgi:hypothetical protein
MAVSSVQCFLCSCMQKVSGKWGRFLGACNVQLVALVLFNGWCIDQLVGLWKEVSVGIYVQLDPISFTAIL